MKNYIYCITTAKGEQTFYLIYCILDSYAGKQMRYKEM